MVENNNLYGDRRLSWAPLSYSLDMGDKEQTVELPFVVTVLADLSADANAELPAMDHRKLLYLESDNFEQLIASHSPCVRFKVPNRLVASKKPLDVELIFRSMDDFRPERISAQVTPMRQLSELRSRIAELVIRLEHNPQLEKDIREHLPEKRKSTSKADFVQDALAEIEPSHNDDEDPVPIDHLGLPPSAWSYVVAQFAGKKNDVRSSLHSVVAEIDGKLAAQLDEILHWPALQRIEGTWRGLSHLAKQTETGSLLRLRVLNATAKELSKEFKRYRGVAFDQAPLFKKLYEEEAYSLGGQPIGLILVDFFFSQADADVQLLHGLAQIGAACMAPVIAGVDPSIFNIDGWSEFNHLRDATNIFDMKEYASWRSLRSADESAYLVMVLPRLLARLPWDTPANIATNDVGYKEETLKNGHYCWMNGAYGVASVITNSFARDRWCADLRGPVWGRIDGVPAHYVVEGDEIVDVVGPTEIDISDQRQRDLALLGLTPLIRHRRGDFAAVMTPSVLHDIGQPEGQPQRDRLHLANQLEHLLCMGRICNVIRSYLRDHSSLFENWEQLLVAMESWLKNFTPNREGEDGIAADDDLTHYPFRDVRLRLARENIDGRDPNIQIELEMNYLPSARPISKVMLISTPPGVLSSRVIP